MYEQGELFPECVVYEPTPSIERGESYVVQCSWCGLLLCASRKVKLGDCPACSSGGSRPEGYPHSWWKQGLDVGPFRRLAAVAH